MRVVSLRCSLAVVGSCVMYGRKEPSSLPRSGIMLYIYINIYIACVLAEPVAR